MPSTAIRTDQLTKRYGELLAVDSLTLDVQAGEIFGLLGPNGAGKTTTILMLLGLTEPSSGRVEVVGLDPAHHALEVKRRVGYVPDAVGFYDDLSGVDNLRYTARLNGLPRRDSEARIVELLAEVGLASRGDDHVGTYSRGMRQRLGLADALLKDPDILILDEPTVAIDPAGVEAMLALIRRLPAERGVTVLLSSHLLAQVQAVCDRVGIFVAGRLVASGTIAELETAQRTQTVTIEVAADSPLDTSVIRGVPGVLDARREGGLVVAEADRDVRADIARALVKGGWTPVHLRLRADDLGRIYQRYFEEADGAAS